MATLQTRVHGRVAPRVARPGALPDESGTVIPFDYAAQFELAGDPGNIIQDVINISPDGVFVAASIGYAFLEDRTESLKPDLDNRTGNIVPGDIELHELPRRALVEGFRVNPSSQTMVFEGDVTRDLTANLRSLVYSDQAVPPELIDKAFQFLRPATDISFLFSMVDSSSGRETSDEPTHNLSSLGTSTGERPFRRLARPVAFLPRSTVRMQVIERTPDVRGSLFIVLYGYKMVVSSACPEPAALRLASRAVNAPPPALGPNHTVIPFDYVAKFTLTGRPGNPLKDEITVNAEGGFVATSIGYGLAVESEEIIIDRALVQQILNTTDPDPNIPLGNLPLSALPPEALQLGIRIRPDYLRIALDANGDLRTLRWSLANRVFETINEPDDVSFLYTISDTGIGREWQNRLIYSVAGLGIANGLRPFKRLEKPRVFPPRATIQVEIQERSGRGTLFLAFQGYKLLGSPRQGVRR